MKKPKRSRILEIKEQIRQHCEAKGYIPSKSTKNQLEKRLAKAFSCISTKSHRHYDEAFSNEIKSKYPRFSKPVTKKSVSEVELRIKNKQALEVKQEIVNFCETNRHIPSTKSQDISEKFLGNAFNNFANKHNYQYDEDFAKQIKAKYPTLAVFRGRNVRRSTLEIKNQILKHCETKGHIPSSSSRDPEEKRLGLAYYSLFITGKHASFLNEIVGKYPSWREFKKKNYSSYKIKLLNLLNELEKRLKLKGLSEAEFQLKNIIEELINSGVN